MSATIRLLVCDVDGTLVRDDKSLPDANRDAIRALEADGVPVTLISARPPGGMRALAEMLGLAGPFAAFNGGTLFDADGTVRFAHRLESADAAAILRLAARSAVTAWVFADGDWFVPDLVSRYLSREQRASALEPTVRTDLAELGGRIDKIVAVSDDIALLGRLEEQAKAEIGARAAIVRSQPHYLDITHPLANKGNGIAALAAANNVGLDAVAAIGDMTNDVPMLARAGLAIAMGQAPPVVREAADFIALTNERSGVADAIQRFVRPRIGVQCAARC